MNESFNWDLMLPRFDLFKAGSSSERCWWGLRLIPGKGVCVCVCMGRGGADCGEGRVAIPNATVSPLELRWLAPNT